jgi:hypothetical protein
VRHRKSSPKRIGSAVAVAVAGAGLVACLASPGTARAAEVSLSPSQEARVPALARSPRWLRLLHFHRTLPRLRFESELEGAGFFMSPQGKRDPEAELRADIQAFADPSGQVGRLKQPAQCAFPVRYAFLKRELGLAIADEPCPLLDDFLKRFKPRSTTLVFSSAYVGNPASMFGHTFLRINAPDGPDGRKLDLLDMGTNYAANIPKDENGLAYAFFGVFGGYPGQFSMEPYYDKVLEYNNGESRDLWEYDLSLSEAETRQLVSHAWEIDTTSGFDYYFVTENCSYQLLALLEAVRPDWDLTAHFIHVIPSETVKKVVSTPGAVTAVRFRPSLRKRAVAAYENLSDGERKAFRGLLDGKLDPRDMGSAAALDAAIEYEHYKKESAGGAFDEASKDLLGRMLRRRSQIPDPPRSNQALLEAMAQNRPDTGHSPYRVGFSGGAMSSDRARDATLGFVGLNLKVAYHDLLNDDRGYSRFSQIDFPWLDLRYRPADRRLSIERLSLGAITSLNPFTVVDRKLSWRIEGDYYSAKDYGCIDCHLLRAEGGPGITLPLFSRDAILTGLIEGYAEAGESLEHAVRGGPMAELLMLVNPLASFKSMLSVRAATDVLQSARPWVFYRLEWASSLSIGQNRELRATLLRYFHGAGDSRYGEAQLALGFYF